MPKSLESRNHPSAASQWPSSPPGLTPPAPPLSGPPIARFLQVVPVKATCLAPDSADRLPMSLRLTYSAPHVKPRHRFAGESGHFLNPPRSANPPSQNSHPPQITFAI